MKGEFKDDFIFFERKNKTRGYGKSESAHILIKKGLITLSIPMKLMNEGGIKKYVKVGYEIQENGYRFKLLQCDLKEPNSYTFWLPSVAHDGMRARLDIKVPEDFPMTLGQYKAQHITGYGAMVLDIELDRAD